MNTYPPRHNVLYEIYQAGLRFRMFGIILFAIYLILITYK